MISRSIFIWYAFLGIASTTYLGSMLAEYASDQWKFTVERIEKRVDRYEKKAELKRLYKNNSSHDLDKDQGKQTSSSSKPIHSRSSSAAKQTDSEGNYVFSSSMPISQSFIRLEMPENRFRILPDRFYPSYQRINHAGNELEDTESEEEQFNPENKSTEPEETWPLLGP
jgi:hypothetical protein